MSPHTGGRPAERRAVCRRLRSVPRASAIARSGYGANRKLPASLPGFRLAPIPAIGLPSGPPGPSQRGTWTMRKWAE
jgi:hypothetical protein